MNLSFCTSFAFLLICFLFHFIGFLSLFYPGASCLNCMNDCMYDQDMLLLLILLVIGTAFIPRFFIIYFNISENVI